MKNHIKIVLIALILLTIAFGVDAQTKSKSKSKSKSITNSAPPKKYINNDSWTKTKASILINGDLMTVKWTNSSGGVSKRDAIRSGKTEIDMIKDERTKFICNDNSGDYFILQDGVSDLIYFYNELGDEYWEINLYREN